MNLDLGSFAFGSTLQSAGGNPSWGTALGQSHPDYKFTYQGVEPILIGMLYCSVPLSTVTLPLGKGGKIYCASERQECQIASLFRKVYINGVRIDYPFVIVLVKEESESHYGRKSIKYSNKNVYEYQSERFSNDQFVSHAQQALGIKDGGCWFVYGMEVYGQNELRMYAVIVDADKSVEYVNSTLRGSEWGKLIPKTDAGYTNSSEEVCDIERPFQQIFYGAPGTGKSYSINDSTKGKDVVRTTFHPDSDYSTFVGAYKPTTIEVPMRDVTGKIINEDGHDVTENRIVYEFVEQAFLQAYTKAWSNLGEPVFLIIEEINRGNCAQIFGDLFQLLDRNDSGFSCYPIKADTDIKRYLKKHLRDVKIEIEGSINALYQGMNVTEQVLNGNVMLLPNNLYIWATMNTSDQSLFPIDSAFKRRWEWKYVPISDAGKQWKIDVNGTYYDWWRSISEINKRIYGVTYSEDKQLGYFFVKAEKKDGKEIISIDKFVGKVLFYLWNDVFKDFGGDPNDFFVDDNGERLTFNKFYVCEDGKAKVAVEKVKRIFENLKLSPDDMEEYQDDENDESETSGRVRYTLNDEPFNFKCDLGKGIMVKYIKEHSNLTFHEIKESFPDRMLGDNTYRGLIVAADTPLGSYSRYYSEAFTSSDGINFKMYKQWTKDNINNIIDFGKKQGWKIDKVEA